MLRKGTILRGIYRIDSYLSSGGFGNTYVATNVEFDERVAIKEFFMRGVTQRDNNQTTVSVSNTENRNSFLEQKEKFKKEARRIRQLKNEHIVNVYDLFDENGTAYYVMDYVDGENLSERLKRTDRAMSESEVRLILPQILDALKAVHDAGIYHLDLKPANIMLEKGGKIKLIDFGASKQLDSQKGGATTGTAITYTNGYAPREQMEQNYDKFGPWTDIYALGATLYTLLKNKRPPLPTDIDDDMSEDKHLALPFPDSVSEDMKSFVLQMLQTNRNLRPQNVDVLLREIYKKSDQKASTPNPHIDIETRNDSHDEVTIVTPIPYKRKEGNSANPAQGKTKQPVKTPSVTHIKPSPKKDSENKGKSFVLLFVAFIIVVFIGGVILSSQNRNAPNNENQESPGQIQPKTVQQLRYKTPIGDCSYTGEVDDNNIPHGKGYAVFEDDRYYQGPFVHGSLIGTDAYFRYGGASGGEFTGEFRDNSFYQGKYTLKADGSYFVGTFKNGQPSVGTWYNNNGTKIEDVK